MSDSYVVCAGGPIGSAIGAAAGGLAGAVAGGTIASQRGPEGAAVDMSKVPENAGALAALCGVGPRWFMCGLLLCNMSVLIVRVCSLS
jgi:hypothetical protein